MYCLEEYCSQNPLKSVCVVFGFVVAGSFWQQSISQPGLAYLVILAGFCPEKNAAFVGLTLILEKKSGVFKL